MLGDLDWLASSHIHSSLTCFFVVILLMFVNFFWASFEVASCNFHIGCHVVEYVAIGADSCREIWMHPYYVFSVVETQYTMSPPDS